MRPVPRSALSLHQPASAWFWLGLLIGQSAMIGCSLGQPKPIVTVAGQASAGGQPLSGAVITFEPIEGTQGPKASAPIFDGSFRIESSANLQPGRFRVRIAMLPAEITSQMHSADPSRPNARTQRREIAPEFDGDSKLTVLLLAEEENLLEFQVSFR